MADTFTTSLELRLQTVGGNNNTWGGFLNTTITNIDTAVHGFIQVSLASADVTLSTSQGRNPVIEVVGTLPADRNLIVKTAVGNYWIVNGTSGAFDVTVKTSAGTGIVVPQGEARLVYCDGTNVETVTGSLAAYDEVVEAIIGTGAVTEDKLGALSVTLGKLATTIQNALVPSGSMFNFAGTSAPTGYLLCYGQAVSRTTYADLFTAIGTAHGVGDGSTTFNLPDGRGRVIAGQDDMGGASANRLTGQTGGVDGDTFGAAGGEERHVLTEAELADHGHPYLTSSASGSSGGDGGFVTQDSGNTVRSAFAGSPTSTAGQQIGGTGSDTAHNNIQPTIILNTIIKT